MLDSMDAGEAFSIGFRTCDKRKQTGGEWIEFPTAVKQNYQFGTASETPHEKTYKRNPNHYKNSTRNIRVMPDGNIVTVHIRLIRRFNSKTVM